MARTSDSWRRRFPYWLARRSRNAPRPAEVLIASRKVDARAGSAAIDAYLPSGPYTPWGYMCDRTLAAPSWQDLGSAAAATSSPTREREPVRSPRRPHYVGSQGVSNVSHGCLNVNPANARWFYDNTKRGDIVEVINTVGPTLSGIDGLGDWNIPWEQWSAGNAAV